tara:strand:+ start:1784 stop:2014 length:231 start_codon:yes stop_codon:yes gene_type:complete
MIKTFHKISNVNDYNNYISLNYSNQIQLYFDKKYGFVFYGYNCFNNKRDFAYWFKTKKQAIETLNSLVDNNMEGAF